MHRGFIVTPSSLHLVSQRLCFASSSWRCGQSFISKVWHANRCIFDEIENAIDWEFQKKFRGRRKRKFNPLPPRKSFGMIYTAARLCQESSLKFSPSYFMLFIHSKVPERKKNNVKGQSWERILQGELPQTANGFSPISCYVTPSWVCCDAFPVQPGDSQTTWKRISPL